jgi:hypothetical protein
VATPAEIDAGLNPAQRDVLAVLGAPADARPSFDAELRHQLRAELEHALSSVIGRAGAAGLLPLSVTKHALSGVHGCEAKYLAELDFPGWSVATARGAVAHKAIELSAHVRGDFTPLDLVDEALARLTESEYGLASWLQTCTEIERAELRAVANDRVATFLEAWPPLSRRWRPVTESRVRVDLLDGAVVLHGKADLTLGHAQGTTARKVLVDLKTGGFAPAHRDDLRFYALLETLKIGVPPRRVATYYLDSARAIAEDVDEDVLLSAVHRLVDGVTRMVVLGAGDAEPVRRAGPPCRWCPLRSGCATADAFERADPDDVDLRPIGDGDGEEPDEADDDAPDDDACEPEDER